jgi:hypothetical protein
VGVTPPQPTGYAADARPDYTKPAIAAPPARDVTPTGAIFEHRGPSYQSQTGEPLPSIFDSPKRGGWMK